MKFMNKQQKISKLFNPEERDILLCNFLAPLGVRKELMAFIGVTNEKDLLDSLGVDFHFLSCRDLSQNESALRFYHGPALPVSETHRVCPFGIRWHRKVRDDKFGVDEAISGPFSREDVTEEDILAFPWPSVKDFDFSPLASECLDHSGRIVIGGLWSAIQGDSSRMMGFENYLLNTALNRPLVKTLVNRVTDFYLEANMRYFEAVKGEMDIFFMGNDFGSQSGLLLSVEDWLDIYYENYGRLINLAHDYGYRVMVHSCGSIEPLLPWFVKLGVDIIDPVQITARDMEPASLSQKYGKDLVFHGAVDTQEILPFGTEDQVSAHVRDLAGKLNEYGNYIVAPSNNILPGTPCRNIISIYETVAGLRSFL